MNYRHAFHAGGFADVVKHFVLARILVHLTTKPAAFRVIDTHAGAALYDLHGREASRTREWREGIGRIHGAKPEPRLRDLLAPYLTAIAAFNRGKGLSTYPGSPLLACALMRAQDRLTACEFEPGAARALAAALRAERRAKVVAIDGWTALTAYVPPKERRGLVLVDPAFEEPHEFARLGEKFAAAHRKWPTGIYLVWYPIKDRAEPNAFARRLAKLGIRKILRAELELAKPAATDRLNGCGLVIVNPPWTLEGELAIVLPWLAATLGDGKGRFRLDWLAGE
jgi:23S rRNA (adenine2030-N6)-methyltransferase